MTVTATSPSASVNTLLAGQDATSGSTAASAADQSDRFLKLLVTQMQNQDPLNPMDNAQVTTQMAQISTVSGIDKLSTTIDSMNGVLQQTQTLQAAALVGKNVQLPGKELTADSSGKASAGFDLAGPADSVVVSVTDASGAVVATIDLGAQGAGRHSFDWQSKGGSTTGLSFAVSARSGAGTVAATTLVSDRVSAVYADGGQLSVETQNHGVVKYADVKAVS